MSKTPETALNDTPRAALVTGAARRIGRAIALDLAAGGTAVAIHCNSSRTAADELAAAIVADGGRAVVVQADLCDRTALDVLVESAAKALGQPLDLLVNNASIFEPDEADAFDWGGWDRHFALHVDAPIMLARRFAERVPVGGEGLIVNIIDQRVLKPTPRYFSYGLSKATLWQATRTMAQGFAPRVRVNAIGPGPTLPNSRQSDAEFAKQNEVLLLRKGPNLAEFGATIRYLWQAKSVTGQMIAIDGGQHLAWQTPDVVGVGE